MYKDESLKKYLDDLSARLPAPGGGSAAAMEAAMGAALMSMVLNFTIGKPKYAHFDAELKVLLKKSEKLREDFLGLIDLDVQAYKSKNLRSAMDVPFMLARLCFEGMKLCPQLIKKGNPNLITDVAVAAVFLESAFSAAYFNVQINLKAIADKELSRSVTRELNRKEQLIKRMRLKTEEEIGQIIRR